MYLSCSTLVFAKDEYPDITDYEPVCCGPEVMRAAGWIGGENAVY